MMPPGSSQGAPDWSHWRLKASFEGCRLMRVQKPCLVLLVGVFASACATSSAKREPSQFKKWPSKPPDCEFDVFEADIEPSEPSRPYEVLGTLALDGNQWMGQEGRKEVLRQTACTAGADVVLLSRPF